MKLKNSEVNIPIISDLKHTLLIGGLFASILFSCSIRDTAIYTIYIDATERYLSGEEIMSNMTIVDTTDSDIRTVALIDYTGSCKLRITDLKGNIVVTGQYTGIDSLIRGISAEENPHTGELKVDTFYYYNPVRDKTWKYYEKGKVINEEIYDKGNLIE